MNSKFVSLDLPLGHSINMHKSTVEFGHPDALKRYTSCELQKLPTISELAAIGKLLMGGADWSAVNDVLKSLAKQKTGKASMPIEKTFDQVREELLLDSYYPFDATWASIRLSLYNEFTAAGDMRECACAAEATPNDCDSCHNVRYIPDSSASGFFAGMPVYKSSIHA